MSIVNNRSVATFIKQSIFQPLRRSATCVAGEYRPQTNTFIAIFVPVGSSALETCSLSQLILDRLRCCFANSQWTSYSGKHLSEPRGKAWRVISIQDKANRFFVTPQGKKVLIRDELDRRCRGWICSAKYRPNIATDTLNPCFIVNLENIKIRRAVPETHTSCPNSLPNISSLSIDDFHLNVRDFRNMKS